MAPCHTTPFVQPGVVIEPTPVETRSMEAEAVNVCDYCGSARVGWRKCKLICDDCKQINKSCADL